MPTTIWHNEAEANNQHIIEMRIMGMLFVLCNSVFALKRTIKNATVLCANLTTITIKIMSDNNNQANTVQGARLKNYEVKVALSLNFKLDS